MPSWLVLHQKSIKNSNASINVLVYNFTQKYMSSYLSALQVQKTSSDRFKPVFSRSSSFQIDDRPQTGLQLRSLPVLVFTGPDWSRSSLVSIFFRSCNQTPKHYSVRICKHICECYSNTSWDAVPLCTVNKGTKSDVNMTGAFMGVC